MKFLASRLLIAFGIAASPVTGSAASRSLGPAGLEQGSAELEQVTAERERATAKTLKFLCSKSFCLDRSVTVRADDDTNGYIAYYHRDRRQVSLSRGLNSIETQLNLVHEFTHAYRARFSLSEETWLDEGLAKFMEYQYSTVWPVSYQEKLRKIPDIRLRNDETDYRKNGVGYTSSFYFCLYLYNHFGGDLLLKKLLESKLTGWDSILTSISELKEAGAVKVDASLISKPSILRHFALALWLNDPFAAKYALFSLDTQFEALSGQTMPSVDLAVHAEHTEQLATGEARIIFSKRPLNIASAEAYAIRSRHPLVIEPPDATGPADIYIYLVY